MSFKVVFGWTDLRRFTIQEDGFEWMKVVWLTWFWRMDQERFAGLHLQWYEEIWRDEIGNYKIVLVNEMKIMKIIKKM